MNYKLLSDEYVEQCEEYAKKKALIELDQEESELLNRFIEILNEMLF